jgi:ABC-type amino acid transport substrate-binding protein
MKIYFLTTECAYSAKNRGSKKRGGSPGSTEIKVSQKFVLTAMLFLGPVLFFPSTAAMGQPEVAQQPRRPKLIVGTIIAPPYSIQGEDGTWSGITVDLWKEIATLMHVDYEFKKENQLKDLLSELKNGTVDIAATGISITAEREKEFDFSDPYLAAAEAVAVNADQQPNMLQVFRSTFVNRTLITLFLFALALPVCGAAALWILEHKGDSEHYSGRTRKAFGRSLFWSTMVLSGKEFPKSIGWSTVSPATFGGRLFGVMWMVMGILLISLFTATAASLLTSKQMQGAIHDQDDLYHVSVCTVANSVGHEYLKHHGIKCKFLYSNAADMLKAVADHKCDAAVFNRHIMVYCVRKLYLNKIDVLHFALRQDFLAIPMRTKYPLKESINDALLGIIESKKWQEIVGTYLGDDWVNAGAT